LRLKTILDKNKMHSALRWVAPTLNIIYKLLVLTALVWIGYGVQDIANAIYTSDETCLVDPDSDASDNRDEDAQPGFIKPLLRGS